MYQKKDRAAENNLIVATLSLHSKRNSAKFEKTSLSTDAFQGAPYKIIFRPAIFYLVILRFHLEVGLGMFTYGANLRRLQVRFSFFRW